MGARNFNSFGKSFKLFLIIHINEQGIPNDIENGMFVEFITSRIDLW